MARVRTGFRCEVGVLLDWRHSPRNLREKRRLCMRAKLGLDGHEISVSTDDGRISSRTGIEASNATADA